MLAEPMLRLFIALKLPARLARQLEQEQRALGGAQAPVKWVSPAGIHLTLQFLGAVAAGRTGELETALQQACQGCASFQLQLQGLGAFPNLRRPRVIWAGVSGDLEMLIRLQAQVVSATSGLGFKAEERPFKPHLTLGRVREGADAASLERLGRAVGARSFSAAEPWHVGELLLMRSELQPSGAHYSTLASIPLAEA